jgi:2-hydroxychromene-2-carboxylate isomerase
MIAKRIEIIAFKGCESALNLRDQVEDLVDTENLETEVKLTIAASRDKAKEIGLFGSPTLRIDGQEYQMERRGPAGFY